MTAPEGYLVKEITDHHELRDVWTFWYCIPDKKVDRPEDWLRFLKVLTDFRSFEDFWAIVNTVEKPADLQRGCRYYIFKKGIQPIWEDQANADGWRFMCEFKWAGQSKGAKGDSAKQDQEEKLGPERETREDSQKKWEELSALVIGNSFGAGNNDVNGIEFNCRNQCVDVGIWTRPISMELKAQIQKDFQERMGRQPKVNQIKAASSK
jgi:translation initiation factor 4E